MLTEGTFVKTKGARDRVGLRRIAAIGEYYNCSKYLIVDHYRWTKKKNGDKVEWYPERTPYSSQVNIDKVVRVFTFYPNGALDYSERVKVDDVGNMIKI